MEVGSVGKNRVSRLGEVLIALESEARVERGGDWRGAVLRNRGHHHGFIAAATDPHHQNDVADDRTILGRPIDGGGGADVPGIAPRNY